jgi:hypothetical protein
MILFPCKITRSVKVPPISAETVVFTIQYTPISLKFKRRLYYYASADGTSRDLFLVSFIGITVANAIIMNADVNSG